MSPQDLSAWIGKSGVGHVKMVSYEPNQRNAATMQEPANPQHHGPPVAPPGNLSPSEQTPTQQGGATKPAAKPAVTGLQPPDGGAVDARQAAGTVQPEPVAVSSDLSVARLGVWTVMLVGVCLVVYAAARLVRERREAQALFVREAKTAVQESRQEPVRAAAPARVQSDPQVAAQNAEAQRVAQSLIDELDARMSSLETLVEQAERVAARLESAVRQPVSTRVASPSRTASGDVVRQRVIELAAEGKSSVDIAKLTDVPPGQVELMISLERAAGSRAQDREVSA